MNKSQIIQKILLARYPCAELPGGALTDIAKEVGCTPEYVRQQAVRLGIVSGKGRKTATWYSCRFCGEAYTRRPSQSNIGYCSRPCRTADLALHLTCDQCSKEYVLSGKNRTEYIQNRERRPLVTHNYCSRRCYGDSLKGVRYVGPGERRRK